MKHCTGSETEHTIELQGNRVKVTYKSENNIVSMMTKHGVLIETNMPEDFGLTRVFQFMESLLKVEKQII